MAARPQSATVQPSSPRLLHPSADIVRGGPAAAGFASTAPAPVTTGIGGSVVGGAVARVVVVDEGVSGFRSNVVVVDAGAVVVVVDEVVVTSAARTDEPPSSRSSTTAAATTTSAAAAPTARR